MHNRYTLFIILVKFFHSLLDFVLIFHGRLQRADLGLSHWAFASGERAIKAQRED